MDIIEMARRAGFAITTSRGSVRVEGLPSDLERFAQEVRAALAEPDSNHMLYGNNRISVDPVTGDVSIGTPDKGGTK